MGKLVRGIGINDVDSPAFLRFPDGPDGPAVWVCPYYRQWANILSRTTKVWQDKYPCYVGVTVCEGWKTYSVFRKWMMDDGTGLGR
jgi:hypothetical protein